MAAAEPPVTYREPGRDGGGAPVPEPGRPLPVAMLYRHCDPAELPIVTGQSPHDGYGS